MALGDAARDLRERIKQHAVEYYPQGKIYTQSDGKADMCGKWVCCSYSENNNDLSFFGLSTLEAAELIHTFDEMRMAKKHPWCKRDEKGKDMTVNDLLKLMALHDKVLITGYESGDVYHEGLVKDVDAHTRALKPRGITARSEDYIGMDAFVQVDVDD